METIVIFSPETNDFQITYTLNGDPYTMEPGQVHTITNDRTWTIEYLLNETGILTRYNLASGRYKFKRQDGVIGLFATRDLPGAGLPTEAPPLVNILMPQTPPVLLLPPAPIGPATIRTLPPEKTVIFSRPDNQFQMVYALNDQPFTMKPGDIQAFDHDRVWTIQFLGSSTGEISSFPLDAGLYEFILGENGVELWVAEKLPELPATPPASAPIPSPVNP